MADFSRPGVAIVIGLALFDLLTNCIATALWLGIALPRR
jgi:hypothetical protein